MMSNKKEEGWLVKLTRNNKYFQGKTNMEVIDEFSPIQIIIPFVLWYFFGILWGLVVGFILYYSISSVLDHCGYEMVKGIDAISAHEIRSQNIRNCACKYL
jgi:ABC-type Fe3+ transport system permease subunit